MKIREVNENKKQFISLLLLADEQESMVDHYLEKGTMYVLEDGNVKAECDGARPGAGRAGAGGGTLFRHRRAGPQREHPVR